jgi:hypothetical protein
VRPRNLHHTGLSTPLFDAAVAARKADIAAQAQHLRMLDDCNADVDETALAVLARVSGVSQRSKRGDFVN